MTIYHLNIRVGAEHIADEEGADFADLLAARDAAIDGIRSLISEDVRNGIIDLTGQIEIADHGGNLVCLVSYSEAVELRLSRRPNDRYPSS